MKTQAFLKIILLSALMVSFSALAQVNPSKNLNVPGTHIFIDPPLEFELSENFIGLEKDEFTAIQIVDLAGGNFYSNVRNFNEENFSSMGINVIELRDSVIDGYDAIILTALDANRTSKSLQVIFGDSTFSVMIMGFVPLNDIPTAQAVWKSIISVHYQKSLIIDPMETAAFTFDDSKSEFKFAKSSANNYIFSLDGVVMDAYIDVPFINLSTMPSSPKHSPKSVSLGLIQGFKDNGYTFLLEEDSFAKVNGYKAYEVVYKVSSSEGEQSKMYSLILKNEKHIVTIIAKIDSDFKNLIDQCKKLSKTIGIK